VLTFLHEYGWIVRLLALYGAVGGFLVVPFRHTIKYALFAAPLAGLLISSCGIAALYTVLGLSLATSTAAMAVVGGAATILALARARPRPARDDLALVVIAAVIAAVATWLANFTTIKLGAPGFLYMDGTDQLGYAQLADWLRTHPVHQLPEATPVRPYESWPEFSFHTDPRFGAYFTLAVIAMLRGESGMFAYDNATALVLLAGYLGIAAVMARSPRSFALLLAGLLTCHWFEYSRSGYFGKTLGYPAALFVVGLFLAARQRLEREHITILAALTCGAAVVFPGTVTALFLVILGGTFLAFRLLLERQELGAIKEESLVLALLVGVAVASSGLLSRPSHALYPQHAVSWPAMLSWLFDVKAVPDDDAAMLRFPSARVLLLQLLAIGVSCALLLAALVKRNAVAFGFIAGPLLLVAALFGAGATTIAYELPGLIYPASLCGAIALVEAASAGESGRDRRMTYGMLALIAAAIALRLPRYAIGVQRYAGAGVSGSVQYVKSDMDGLAAAIGRDTVTVSVTNRVLGIPILVELGRRQLPMRWTPDAYRAILGYRPWTIPEAPPTGKRSLRLDVIDAPPDERCTVTLRTRQYKLLECRNEKAPAFMPRSDTPGSGPP
jgi:hypothetical protein